MLDKYLISRLLKTALQKGGDFAEIYVEEKRLSSALCEENQIEKIYRGYEKGIGIRLIHNYRTAYVYTNDFEEKSLYNAAAMVAGILAQKAPQDSGEISLQLQSAPTSQPYIITPDEFGFNNKIALMLEVNETARQVSPQIRQVSVAATDLQKKIQIANSEGELIENDFVRVRLALNVIAAAHGELQTAYETIGGVSGWELIQKGELLKQAESGAWRAVNMLSARPAPTGRMPVVMSAEAGGTMVHEACGHSLEADLVQKGLSIYKGKKGQKVASPLVTVVDDPTIPHNYGSFVFDDEGVAGKRNVLINKGILENYMYDRLTAKKDNTFSTGNGRRESYQHKPVPRMSNTFIAPGEDNLDSILRDTPKGLFVKKMGGGQVNTTTGNFVFDVKEAYMIENGRITYPVRGATLTGNGPRVLNDIDRVAGDLGFAIGICGKEGQGVPVGDAQPSIRISELIVGGTS